MNFEKKIITPLYLITVYTFPFLVLFLIFTAIQLHSLTTQKEKIISGLSGSSEALRTLQTDLDSLKKNIGQLNAAAKDIRVAGTGPLPVNDNPLATGSGKNRKALLDMTPSTVRRARKMMHLGIDYSKEPYFVSQRTARYYAIVISYDDLAFALVQREHLASQGFAGAKILVLKGKYAVSIADAPSKSDKTLLRAIEKWSVYPDNEKLPFLKKY